MTQKRKKRPSAPASAPAPAAKPARKRRSWPRLSPFLITFVLLWAFVGGYYSPVFYVVEQNSFFAFNGTLMHYLLQQEGGWLMAAGRLLLLSFRYPWLGGALLALMLTLSGRLFNYACCLPARFRWAGHVVAFAPVFYLMWRHYGMFYQSEPSIVFTIPLVLLVVAGLAAVVVRLATHRRCSWSWRGTPDEPQRARIVASLAAVVLWGGLMGYAQAPVQQSLRISSAMYAAMGRSDWEGMKELALEARRPDRNVAAYYAIALLELDQLPESLFELHFRFPDERLRNRAGEEIGGPDNYVADVSFYSGLINPSYQVSMTRFVGDGPTVATLKNMTRCAVLNGERALAERYLHVLDYVPGEGRFVREWTELLTDSTLIGRRPELALARVLMPLHDNFEQAYQQPTFLGYYANLIEGRSMRTLRASLAACLYTKNLPNLVQRVALLGGQSLPQAVEDGLAVYALKHPEVLQTGRVSDFAQMRLREFLVRVRELGVADKQKTAAALRDTYSNYYPFYYFFENLPEDMPQSQRQKGGVN